MATRLIIINYHASMASWKQEQSNMYPEIGLR